MKNSQHGIGALALLLAVAVIIGIGLAGLLVFNNQKTSDADSEDAQMSSAADGTDLPADLLACAKKNGAPLERGHKTVTCGLNDEKPITHAALPAVVLPAVKASMVGWSALPAELQSALERDWPPECGAADARPSATMADPQSVTLADDKKSAILGMACGPFLGSAAYLYALTSDGWKDVGQTQMAYKCETLVKYHVPKAVVGRDPESSTCYDNNGIERELKT